MPNPEHFMIHTGTLFRVSHDGASDDYGTPAETTTTEQTKCWVYETPGDEATDGANWQTRKAELWLPAGTDPTGLDRIDVNGRTWQFTSPPRPAVNARTGVTSHMESNVQATT